MLLGLRRLAHGLVGHVAALGGAAMVASNSPSVAFCVAKPAVAPMAEGVPPGDRSRWSREHKSPEECALRAQKVTEDPEALLHPYLANWATSMSTLLNVPPAFLVHQLSPLFGACARYVRASRYHAQRHPGHSEPLNFNKLLGADSGTGKSQAMTACLTEFLMYEKTMGRDLVVRNMTIESLESRMSTNAQREEPLVQSAYQQGGALLLMDEASKLVHMGQYKSGGKGDHRERFMEASNGVLVKTDRKGGSTKLTKAGSASSATNTPSSASMDDNDDENTEATFTSSLTTEAYYPHLNTVLFTHPFRVAGWTNAEQEADGTDGWTVRLKTTVVSSMREPTKGRDELIEIAESPGLKMPLYHLLVASTLICEALPQPSSKLVPFKLLEYDDDCEAEHVKWDKMVCARSRELQGAPKSDLEMAVHSKTVGDLIKETGCASLQRMACTVVSKALELQDYDGTDRAFFEEALRDPIKNLLASAPRAWDGYPQLCNINDMTLAKARVTLEMNTALALMVKSVREVPPEPLRAEEGDGGGLHVVGVPMNKGRHDLTLRENKNEFKIRMPNGKQEVDELAYFLHVILTAPRIDKNLISMTSLYIGTPRINMGNENGEEPNTTHFLVKELAARGLATSTSFKLSADQAKFCGSRTGTKRWFIRVKEVGALSDAMNQAYGSELKRIRLTLADLLKMNDDTLPLDEDVIKSHGTHDQLCALLKGRLPVDVDDEEALDMEDPPALQEGQDRGVRPATLRERAAAAGASSSAEAGPSAPTELEAAATGSVTAAEAAIFAGLAPSRAGQSNAPGKRRTSAAGLHNLSPQRPAKAMDTSPSPNSRMVEESVAAASESLLESNPSVEEFDVAAYLT